MSDFKKVNEQIAESVTSGYKKIEDGVVGRYKKIESGVVDAFKKVEDKFVGKFLTHEGETVEEAEARLAAEQTARAERAKADANSPDISHNFFKDGDSYQASQKYARQSNARTRP